MEKRVFDGSINYIQIMDENGNVDENLRPKELTDGIILQMYKYMSLTRALDAKMLSLQRQGRAATYGPSLGEEAAQVGSAMAMGPKDFFVPNFRQHGTYITRGMPLDALILYWKGYEEGIMPARKINAIPYIVPVSTQLLHAVGLAYSQLYQNTGASVITFVGDGGTSEGNFYESMNFAGILKAPVAIIIENNQWAISEPRSRQTVAPTLAQKAIAAGIPGVQVDGNDVLAVYKVVRDALTNAKNGPTLIECITYRMSMHTTADDPTKYRPDADVEKWKPRDPILRVGNYLRKKALWDDSKQSAMEEEHRQTIDAAVEKAEQFKKDPKSMFENIYATMPAMLKEEEDAAVSAQFWMQKNDGE
ncbi:MAG: pyruvate dehydrogenase (acetyl-transferring) E1 component subunit alpha [Candidatus Marsarchaeota archaeon]|nr:pyruvate dehydrogenase (acetyl-transferring) E1 component subunit alpha [Candidatus Marsarchaeota archaeon]